MTVPRPRLFLRLIGIQRTLTRFGLDEIVHRTHLLRPLIWFNKAMLWGRDARQPLGIRLRRALEELGPLFVKFGQALSVRRDLLPEDIADELAKLQDRVPPFSSEQAVSLLEQALEAKLDDLFDEFEHEPLAAASVAQVHAAKLPDGQGVAVKILRPKVRELIERDIEVLYAVAGLAERYWREARRLRPLEVVAEFEKSLLHELDLMREAASAAQLKRNFEGSELLYVPEVHWEYCRSNVLVTERVFGIPISDVEALKRHGTDLKRLAENGVEIFFTQVFRHNFFHADMHPGNIFVDVADPKNPRYIAVDFGIVGSLTDQDQYYLAENFLAFFNRDYRRVAELHVSSGWVPKDTRIDELEAAVRTVCEPIFEKPLKDISFGMVLVRLFETAREFDAEVQPQLVLLQKTLLAIEGLGRELYPELDLWRTAKPILEAWVKERMSPATQLQRLIRSWPQISEDLSALPDLLHRALREPEKRQPSSDDERRRAAASRDRRWRQLAAGGIVLLASVLWSGFDAEPVVAGWAGGLAGCLLLLGAVWR